MPTLTPYPTVSARIAWAPCAAHELARALPRVDQDKGWLVVEELPTARTLNVLQHILADLGLPDPPRPTVAQLTCLTVSGVMARNAGAVFACPLPRKQDVEHLVTHMSSEGIPVILASPRFAAIPALLRSKVYAVLTRDVQGDWSSSAQRFAVDATTRYRLSNRPDHPESWRSARSRVPMLHRPPTDDACTERHEVTPPVCARCGGMTALCARCDHDNSAR